MSQRPATESGPSALTEAGNMGSVPLSQEYGLPPELFTSLKQAVTCNLPNAYWYLAPQARSVLAKIRKDVFDIDGPKP